MDVAKALDELQEALGVDGVAIWCWSGRVLETAWVTSHDDGIRVTDRGETHEFFLDDDEHEPPGEETLIAICSRFGVHVAAQDEVGYVLERFVEPGGDVREAVRAVLSAQDAIFAAFRMSQETGGSWSEDVLAAGREHEIPFDEA
jgi:hypothetical protein